MHCVHNVHILYSTLHIRCVFNIVDTTLEMLYIIMCTLYSVQYTAVVYDSHYSTVVYYYNYSSSTHDLGQHTHTFQRASYLIKKRERKKVDFGIGSLKKSINN